MMQKLILLLLVAFIVTACGEKEPEVIHIKVVDKSTYSYTPQNTTTTNTAPTNELAPQVVTKTSAKTNGGKWQSPVNANISQRFAVDNKSVHFATKQGMDVAAIADGVVVYSSGNLKAFGNMVIIKHMYGFYSYYMFVGNLIAQVGDNVTKGQTIAQTGERNLVLQMKKNTTTINPEDYL